MELLQHFQAMIINFFTRKRKATSIEQVQQFIDDNNSWSVEKFGDCLAVAPLTHLSKEVRETINAILFDEPDESIRMEFADCFILLMQSAHKFGLSFEDVFNAAKKKMEINKRRTWGRNNDGTYGHIK